MWFCNEIWPVFGDYSISQVSWPILHYSKPSFNVQLSTLQKDWTWLLRTYCIDLSNSNITQLSSLIMYRYVWQLHDGLSSSEQPDSECRLHLVFILWCCSLCNRISIVKVLFFSVPSTLKVQQWLDAFFRTLVSSLLRYPGIVKASFFVWHPKSFFCFANCVRFVAII